MRNAELERKVRSSLKEVVSCYAKSRRYILTEQDLVIRCYERLKLAKLSGFEIRAGLMPYRGKGKSRRYVNAGEEHIGWTKVGANRGAMIDVCVIRDDKEYWERAKNARGAVEYWRFPSYPYEAFAAVIELKARVNGNIRRVLKDVRKLSFLSRELDIAGFLVALDRCATDEDRSKIDAAVGEENRIVALYYRGNDRP